MSHHPTDFQGSVVDAIRDAIKTALPDANPEVEGGGGHFTIDVASKAFDGKGTLERHRLVLSAIAHLMDGDRAPVHAIDTLKTRVP